MGPNVTVNQQTGVKLLAEISALNSSRTTPFRSFLPAQKDPEKITDFIMAQKKILEALVPIADRTQIHIQIIEAIPNNFRYSLQNSGFEDIYSGIKSVGGVWTFSERQKAFKTINENPELNQLFVNLTKDIYKGVYDESALFKPGPQTPLTGHNSYEIPLAIMDMLGGDRLENINTLHMHTVVSGHHETDASPELRYGIQVLDPAFTTVLTSLSVIYSGDNDFRINGKHSLKPFTQEKQSLVSKIGDLIADIFWGPGSDS